MAESDKSSKVLEMIRSSGKEWTEEAEKFCDEPCIQRYLRARNGDVSKAAKMLSATLKWRKENDVDQMKIEDFDADVRSGFMYMAGHDPGGRPVMMMRKRTSKLVGAEVEQYLRYLTFIGETAGRSMKNGAETWVWILDMDCYNPANAPALSTSAATVQILQDHYPERLGKVYIVNVPQLFQLFYGLLSPFMDPITRAKVEFVNVKGLHPSAPSSHKSSTWASLSSWASSSSSRAKKQPEHEKPGMVVAEVSGPAAAGGGPGSKAQEEQQQPTCGSTCFQPLLEMYKTPFQQQAYDGLLRACGW